MHIIQGEYTILISDDYPKTYHQYRNDATFVEVLDDNRTDSSICCVAVAKGKTHPFLIVVQNYHPGPESGFYPDVLLVPETHLLFIGAGNRLLAYGLNPPRRHWKEQLTIGFWRWERYQESVVMSAELELATWDIAGKKLWSTFVEPPWNYHIENEIMHLDVMGKHSSFSLRRGPIALG